MSQQGLTPGGLCVDTEDDTQRTEPLSSYSKLTIMANVIVGVDVGGTNTDAVLLWGHQVISSAKTSTTPDVTSGVCRAITHALNDAQKTIKGDVCVSRIHIGTTHFVNAVVQRRNLVKVAVVRLCGPATLSLPPYSDFPADLKQVVSGGVHMVDGGYQFDGKSEIKPVNTDQLFEVAQKLKADKVNHAVVSAIFSPVNNDQEQRAAEILRRNHPDVNITLSSSIGTIGLLERENAAILNESLRPLAQQTINAFREALDELGLTCPFYLSQNDGTLLSADQALDLPVHTFASGPTNSMRGATFLSGQKDAVVVDIGGTSTDVGVIVKGFPREAGVKAKVGGVTTNFRMPDVLSIGLGGGSIVRHDEKTGYKIGPDSVGYRLQCEALVFGGQTLTTTDIAVSSGLAADIGNKESVAQLSEELVQSALKTIHSMLEGAIDQVRVSSADVVAVLVGGGSVLIDPSTTLTGISEIIKPPSFEVANAVGAALSQIAGCVDRVVSLEETSREEAIEQARALATTEAISAGADPTTIETVDVMEVPLAYVPGNATRVKVRVVGDLQKNDDNGGVVWKPRTLDDIPAIEGVAQVSSSTGGSLNPAAAVEDHLAAALVETDPTVDPLTGEWLLSGWDVECISVGAGILGCGGGGSPDIGRLKAHLALQQGKTIRVIHPERLRKQMKDEDCVAPLAVMGAPTICIERLPSLIECTNALNAMKDLYNHGDYDDNKGTMRNQGHTDLQNDEHISYIDDYQPPTESTVSTEKLNVVALVSDEIGGSNSFEPLVLGADTGLPVVDCDGMGRAFPELQMCIPFINGHKPYPSTLADHSGRRAVVLSSDTPKELENHFRAVVCDMGCMGALVTRVLRRDEVKPMMVAYSVSRAWRLGKAVLYARRNNLSPVQAILEHEGAHLLATGKIGEIERLTKGGFARGVLHLEGLGEYTGRAFKVKFQNENLVATEILSDKTQKVLACTPDLLSLVSADGGQPVATEEVRYGLRVSLLAIPAPPELTTPQALQVVGPHAFGYPPEEVTYKPVGQYVFHQPIPNE